MKTERKRLPYIVQSIAIEIILFLAIYGKQDKTNPITFTVSMGSKIKYAKDIMWLMYLVINS